MTAPRVLVVEHQADAGLGYFGDRLRDAGLDLQTVGPDTGHPVPDALTRFDGLIVLGGSMGPTDDEVAPWLPATRKLLAEAVHRQVPTLGICLGAQLLATAAGGQVREMPGGPEVGLLRVRVAQAAAGDPLFDTLRARECAAVQWHWLEAAVLPDGATVLASSGACQNQVFRVGESAWGVQFHPEALGDTARDWADETGADLVPLGLNGDDIVAEVRRTEPELQQVWGGLAERFAAIVAARRAVAA